MFIYILIKTKILSPGQGGKDGARCEQSSLYYSNQDSYSFFLGNILMAKLLCNGRMRKCKLCYITYCKAE